MLYFGLGSVGGLGTLSEGGSSLTVSYHPFMSPLVFISLVSSSIILSFAA